MFKSFISGSRGDILSFDPELAAFLEDSQEELPHTSRNKLNDTQLNVNLHSFLPLKREYRNSHMLDSIPFDTSDISVPFLHQHKKAPIMKSKPTTKSVSYTKAVGQHPEIQDITLKKVDVGVIPSLSKTAQCLFEVDGLKNYFIIF